MKISKSLWFPMKWSLLGMSLVFMSGEARSADVAPCSKQVTSVVRALMMVNGDSYRLLNVDYVGTVETAKNNTRYLLRASALANNNDDESVYDAYASTENCRVVRVEHVEK